MPLTDFQAVIARLLSANRSPDNYLAGGAALHLEPQSVRYSNDLDYFQDSEERVATAFADDEKTLCDEGYEVEVILRQPGFVRALARRDGNATKVDWAHDSAWRFLPVVESERVGFLLHPIDLAINKVMALVGRDEPRDYLDVHVVIQHTLPLGALCWAASGKDPGYTPELLLDLLRRRGKYRPEDFSRLALDSEIDLPGYKRRWLAALADAERFLLSRSSEELGCLYYDPDLQEFVQPRPGQDVILHFGRPGGVLPVIGGKAS